jgi:GxxExxY protein
MYQLSEREKLISKEIVDAAFKVHNQLGPGLLEKIYEICFCHELIKKGLRLQRQLLLPVVYDGLHFEESLRLDVLVEDNIICELKAMDIVNPVWQAQVLSHLKITGKHIGFLINFNVTKIKEGIRRYCIE